MKPLFFKVCFLFSVLSCVLFSSCKKDNITADDPTILHISMNKSITTSPNTLITDTLDLNQDGVAEVLVQLNNLGADTGFIQVLSYNQKSQFSYSTLSSYNITKMYTKGDIQPYGSAEYYSYPYVSLKSNANRLGILDSGEHYLTFKFTTGSKYNYGWMKVSINSTYTEFKIIEYAYSTTLEKPITVGAQ